MLFTACSNLQTTDPPTSSLVAIYVWLGLGMVAAMAQQPSDSRDIDIQLQQPTIRDIAGWTLQIAPELLSGDAQLTDRAIELLQAQLQEIVRVVPHTAVVELQKVPLYFSPEYPGKQPTAEFHPSAKWLRDNGRKPAMAQGVEFTNIRTFESESRRMPNFALHELAHAYHHRVLTDGFRNAEIIAAFERAQASGLYEQVERRDAAGRSRIERAYALSSAMEYFAETTEAFFTRNDFFPFTNSELQQRDPNMFALLGKLWQLNGPVQEPLELSGPEFRKWQLVFAESRLRAIYERREFSPAAWNANWLRDSTGYLRLENTGSSLPKLVKYDCASGERSVLIDDEQLVVPGTHDRLRILQFTESPIVGQFLLRAETDSDDRSANGYWICNAASGELERVMTKIGSLDWENAFSPDGKHILFRRDSNLMVYDTASDQVTTLTRDGKGGDIENGNSATWSPDSKKIAYIQSDVSKVRQRSAIQPTDPSYPAVRSEHFARVGETIATFRVGVVSTAGGETQWIDVPAKPGDFYIHTLSWTNHSDELCIELLSRGRDARTFLMANTDTGGTATAYQESDTAWVDSSFRTNAGLDWIQDGKVFLLLSERDGWRHAFLASRDGAAQKLITDGAYDITERGPVDEASGWFSFMASPDNATQRYLYRIRLDGSASAERLTPDNQPGTHAYDFSPDGQWAFHTYSTFDSPPVIDLVHLPEHRVVRVLEDNSEIRQRIAPLIVRPTDFFQVDIGQGVVMDAWMIKPRDFDETKKYPVFVFVYGEPHGQTVLDDWRGGQNHTMFHRMLADLGYLVVSIDNRGTPAPKGAAWRRSVFGSLGPLSTEEQAQGLQELARTRPFVDLSRVGIWGWSGGGSNTLNAMFRRPDVYHVGIAVAAKPQPHLYNAWFQEIYMRTQEENPDGYRLAAAINFAEGLRGNLLIIHGTGETNTHLPIIEGLVDRLIELGKPFDYMAYPNRDHGLREGKGTEVHMRMLMTRYLIEHLPPGPRTMDAP